MSPDLIKKIAGLVVYLCFFYYDAHDWWSQSHASAIAFGAIATIALLFYEIPTKLAGIGSATVITASIVLYVIVGPAPPPEPWRGWLQPANEPTPENGCDRPMPPGFPDFPKETPTLIAGSNGLRLTKSGKIRVISVGTCDALTLERSDEGIRVTAPLYDKDSSHLGDIVNNEYSFTKEQDLIVEHSGDLSTLVVHDKNGKELLYVRYLNPRAIKVRGQFVYGLLRCPRLVHI